MGQLSPGIGTPAQPGKSHQHHPFPISLGTAGGGGAERRGEASSSFCIAALKSNNSIQVEEGWQLGGKKKEKQTIKKINNASP